MISDRTARSTLRSELTFLVSVRVPHGCARPVQRGVDVAAQRALLHPHVGDAERADHVAQLGHVRPGDLRRPRPGAGDRLGDDLDQRDAGPVVVDQRLGGAVDPAGGAADVQGLAGVLLQVHPLDADPDHLAVDLDVQPAVDAERLVVLADLEVLRHVRVEVVLPGEPAPGRDGAVERQPDAGWSPRSRPCWPPAGCRAGPRQTGQTWVLGSAPKSVGQPQNILVLRAQLDVGLQADHRLVAGDHVVVRGQGRGHRTLGLR